MEESERMLCGGRQNIGKEELMKDAQEENVWERLREKDRTISDVRERLKIVTWKSRKKLRRRSNEKRNRSIDKSWLIGRDAGVEVIEKNSKK